MDTPQSTTRFIDDYETSWAHEWAFQTYELEDLEDLEAFAAQCLSLIVRTACNPRGSGIPGTVFHYAPYVQFQGVDARDPGHACVIVAQTGGLDI
jgi:hypothetical protein